MPLLAAAVLGGPLAAPVLAADDLPFTQQVKLVKDGMSGSMKYRVVREEPVHGAVSSGKVRYDFDVFQLVESDNSWDYYLLDAEVKRGTSGGKHPFPNVQVMLSTFAGFKHNKATYTTGRQSFERKCKTYNVNLGASYGPVGAGTTVTTIESCDNDPRVTRRLSNKLENGTYRNGTYDIRAMHALPRVGMQKWIRVKEGKTPPFYVRISPRRTKCVEMNPHTDKCIDWKDFWADGRKQLLQYEDATRR